MRLIFLDIDGVLNSDPFLIRQCDMSRELSQRQWPGGHLDPVNVARLERLVSATGARLVLSSAWRTMISLGELYHLLLERGYTGQRFLGRTPSGIRNQRFSEWVPRGAEIKEWLDDWADNAGDHVDSYVILDDSSDMLPEQEPFFVNTDAIVGLTEEDVDRAAAILQTWGV